MLEPQEVENIIVTKMTTRYAQTIGFAQVAQLINGWTPEKKAEWISLVARGDAKGMAFVQSEILNLARTKAQASATKALSDNALSLTELQILLG